MAAAATTLSMLAPTMLSIQETSAAKQCDNDDANNNNNNDDNGKTCANQQQEDSKNRDPSYSASNAKNSTPFRLSMPFP